jgi:hypothetical protein
LFARNIFMLDTKAITQASSRTGVERSAGNSQLIVIILLVKKMVIALDHGAREQAPAIKTLSR